MLLREFVSLVTDSTNPKKYPSSDFVLFSLPAFDDLKRPELLKGSEIDSNKYIVPKKCILFNKLNVRFKRIWRIENSKPNYLCSTEFLPLVINEDIVDFDYIYYYLTSDFITNYLCNPTTNTSGSHKRIDPEFLFDINVELPSLQEQKKIGEFLKLIDDKILNNEKFIFESTEFLNKIFNAWFFSFNYPNEHKKAYKENGGEMRYDAFLKKDIPVDWKSGTLRDYIEVIRGVSYKPEDSSDSPADGFLPLLRSNNIYAGQTNYKEVIYVNHKRIHEDQFLNKGDIFICMSNGSKSLIGKNSTYLSRIKRSFGAFCAKIVVKDPNMEGFINCYFKSDYYLAYVAQICANTSINNLGNDMLYDSKTVIPSNEVIISFNNLYKNIEDKCSILHDENEQLKKDLNTFVSSILSGQIKVGD